MHSSKRSGFLPELTDGRAVAEKRRCVALRATSGSSTVATETGPCFFGEKRTRTWTTDLVCAHCTAGTTTDTDSAPPASASCATLAAPSLYAIANRRA